MQSNFYSVLCDVHTQNNVKRFYKDLEIDVRITGSFPNSFCYLAFFQIMHQIKQKLEACLNASVRLVLELCRGARITKLLMEFTIVLYFIKWQELFQ